ncbi:unnamed protein product [Calypogeia fissa]
MGGRQRRRGPKGGWGALGVGGVTERERYSSITQSYIDAKQIDWLIIITVQHVTVSTNGETNDSLTRCWRRSLGPSVGPSDRLFRWGRVWRGAHLTARTAVP